MAGNSGYQDISALLKSLTAYAPAHLQPQAEDIGESSTSHSQTQAHPQPHQQDRNPPSQSRYNAYYASSDQPYSTAQNNNVLQPQTQTPSPSAAPEPQPPPPQSQTPTPSPATATKTHPQTDPRTITTWSAAIRHLTTLLARDPSVSKTVKQLIANQHENERTWWASREALLKQHAARETGQKQLDAVLRSVGAQPSSGPESAQDPTTELTRHTAKVHAAATKMVAAMAADLQALGVPFFGLRPELVAESDADADDSAADDQGGRATTAKITKAELAALQRKMLAFLEEYCME